MSGSASVMARFLALAFFIVVGMGVYTFIVKSDLQSAQQQLADTQKDRDTWKTRLTQYQSEDTATKASLEQCNGQVKDLQAQMEAAAAATAKKPAGAHKH